MGCCCSPSTTDRFQVKGMSCQHCVNTVQDALKSLMGVQSVKVDLAHGTVDVISVSGLCRDDVEAVIQEAGYQLA